MKKNRSAGVAALSPLANAVMQVVWDGQPMTAEDVLFRRGKLGLHMSADQINGLKNWFSKSSE